MTKRLVAIRANENYEKCKKILTDFEKQSGTTLSKAQVIKTIKKLGDEFYYLRYDIENLNVVETHKCEICNQNDSAYIRKRHGDNKEVCADCAKKIDAEATQKQMDLELRLFKKRLLEFFKIQTCKYVEFPVAWKYFYKNFKMSKHDFNTNLMLLKIHPNGLHSIELHDKITDSRDYYAQEKAIFVDINQYINREEYRNFFKLFTISAVKKELMVPAK